MNQEEIIRAFENRWRIKGNFGQMNQNAATMSFDEYFEYIKGLCRDFFEAGICLGEGEHYPSIPMSAIKNAAYEVIGFETFWNLYEKKVGRPKCEKLWSKLTLEEKKKCLDYIPLYKQAQPEKCYRKNPETFLRNKSWNDELIFRNNGTNQPTLEQQRKYKLADILTD